jgi:hypothetical protein
MYVRPAHFIVSIDLLTKSTANPAVQRLAQGYTTFTEVLSLDSAIEGHDTQSLFLHCWFTP